MIDIAVLFLQRTIVLCFFGPPPKQYIKRVVAGDLARSWLLFRPTIIGNKSILPSFMSASHRPGHDPSAWPRKMRETTWLHLRHPSFVRKRYPAKGTPSFPDVSTKRANRPSAISHHCKCHCLWNLRRSSNLFLCNNASSGKTKRLV